MDSYFLYKGNDLIRKKYYLGRFSKILKTRLRRAMKTYSKRAMSKYHTPNCLYQARFDDRSILLMSCGNYKLIVFTRRPDMFNKRKLREFIQYIV